MNTSNITTARHISAILRNAIRQVQQGSTLKACREYMVYQLVTRIAAGHVEGIDLAGEGEARLVCDAVCKMTRKDRFIGAAAFRADEYEAYQAEHRAAWLARKAAEKAAQATPAAEPAAPLVVRFPRADLEAAYENASTREERDTALEVLRRHDAEIPAGTRAKIATQCTDHAGRTGCFLFAAWEGQRVAVSPVFASLTNLYDWCSSYDWVCTGDDECTRSPQDAPAVRTYESQQAALDSGDWNHGAMSSAMLKSAIARGEVRIVPRQEPIHAAPRMFDLQHLACDAVIEHRTAKAWIWKSGSNTENRTLLGWMHEGERRAARLECAPEGDRFWWRDEADSARRGLDFGTVADAVRDFFASQTAPESEEAPAAREGEGWAIVNGPRQIGVVGVLMLQGQRVGAVTWSTAYTPHLFRVQLANETHGFNERHAALDWAAARLAYLAGDDRAANDAPAAPTPARPKVEEYKTAVLSTAHMMPRDWDLLAENAIDTATDNGLFWVHDTPCGSILRFAASADWQQELTDIGASVMLITAINALESMGFHAAHFDRDADTVEGLDTCEEVEA